MRGNAYPDEYHWQGRRHRGGVGGWHLGHSRSNRRFSHEPYDPAMTLFQLSVQDGRQLDPTRDAYIYYDDLVLGDSRIGCAPPPPAPTGLTIK